MLPQSIDHGYLEDIVYFVSSVPRALTHLCLPQGSLNPEVKGCFGDIPFRAECLKVSTIGVQGILFQVQC